SATPPATVRRCSVRPPGLRAPGRSTWRSRSGGVLPESLLMIRLTRGNGWNASAPEPASAHRAGQAGCAAVEHELAQVVRFVPGQEFQCFCYGALPCRGCGRSSQAVFVHVADGCFEPSAGFRIRFGLFGEREGGFGAGGTAVGGGRI